MVKCNFTLDIIVVSVDIPSLQDARNLAVNIIFNNIPITLTSRCKTLRKFRSGRSYEFEENSISLMRKFRKYPLELILSFDDVILAESQMMWPQNVLEKIDGTTQEITHVAKMKMKSAREFIGEIELIIRLKSEPIENTKKTMRTLIANTIDIGQNERCSLTHDQSKKKQNEKRHFSKFGTNVQYRDLLNLSKQCEELIEATERRNSKRQSISTPIHECRDSYKHTRVPDKPIRDMVSNICRNQSRNQTFEKCRHCQRLCGGLSVVPENKAKMPTSPEQYINHPLESNYLGCRYCPVCNTDLTWRPHKSPCPTCHHVSVGLDERDRELTADDVLEEYMFKHHCAKVGKEKCDVNCTRTQCKCTEGEQRPCAHCRIRSLCSSISGQPCENKILGNKSNDDKKAHLSHIFSELRKLYELNYKTNTHNDATNRGRACEAEMREFVEMQKQLQRSRYVYLNKLRKLIYSPLDKVQGTVKEGPVKASKLGKPTSARENTTKSKKPTVIQNTGNNEKTPRRSTKRLKGVYTKTPRKITKSEIFPENVGDRTPRIYDRHKKCCDEYKHTAVPPYMGWRWTSNENYQRGWKPGFIPKSVKEIMEYFVQDFPTDTIPNTKKCAGHKNSTSGGLDQEELPSMLNIKKTDNEYIITMKPLKSNEDLKHSENPFVEMKPLQFKVTKNPVIVHHRNLKRILKSMGFPKCTCHQPISQCSCRSYEEKKLILLVLKQECTKQEVPFYKDTLVLSDTTASENELEFSIVPPVARLKTQPNNLINQSTQYNRNDWLISKRGGVLRNRFAAALYPKLFPRKPRSVPQEKLIIVVGKDDTPVGDAVTKLQLN